MERKFNVNDKVKIVKYGGNDKDKSHPVNCNGLVKGYDREYVQVKIYKDDDDFIWYCTEDELRPVA